MKHMMKTVGQSNTNPVNSTESEVVKEFEEREKRESSSIVKCLLVESL